MAHLKKKWKSLQIQFLVIPCLNPGIGDNVEKVFMVGNSSLNFFTADFISEFPNSIPCKPVCVDVME